MRISTSMIFQTGSNQLSNLQSTMQQQQIQLSTGLSINSPADNPVAAAQVLQVTQAQSANTQYGTNRQAAESTLGLVSNALSSFTTVLQDSRTLLVQAGNLGSSTSADSATIANQLSQNLTQMISLANAQDGDGHYMFSGFQSTTPAFTQTATGAQYNGDQGQQFLQVGTASQVAISNPGDAVFNTIKTVVTAASASNTGNGAISPGTVTDASELNGDSYQLTFTGNGSTYNVTNTATGLSVSTGNAYVSGQTVDLPGIQFKLTGVPVAGDVFTVTPKNNQSIFSTITDAINALNGPSTANVANGVSQALGNVDQTLNNILTVQASVGSNINELTNLDSEGSSLGLQYSETISNLQGLNYAQAISNYSMTQTTLQAAEKSYTMLTGLSLFSELP